MEKSIEELVHLSLEDQSYTLLLWGKMKPLCLNWAYKLRDIEEDIEDLYQESYLLLLKALKHYEAYQNMKFESYFKLVLYSWGRDYKHKYRTELIQNRDDQDFWESVEDTGEGVEDYMINQERYRDLAKGLKHLSQLEYELLIDFYMKGHKISEIATRYHMSYKALETKKRRTLKKLKEIVTHFEGSSVYIEYKQPVLKSNPIHKGGNTHGSNKYT